eukprot:gene13632-biopygen15572
MQMSNKLEEQARAKVQILPDEGSTSTKPQQQQQQQQPMGDVSYSSWVNTNQPANSEAVPKKLSPGEAAQLQQDTEQTVNQKSASAWNAAGTFEERTLPEGRDLLIKALEGTSCGTASITQCSILSGDAHIWWIRGKRRVGFEFEVELTWQISGNSSSSSKCTHAAAVQGTMKLPSASPDELDELHIQDVKLSNSSSNAAADASALTAAKGLKGSLEAALSSYYEELKKM